MSDDAQVVGKVHFDGAKALLAAVSKEESRPILNYVLIDQGFAVATNGHALVRVPLFDSESERKAFRGTARFLLHRSSLKHVSKNTHLQVDLATGACCVASSKDEDHPGYPIELPSAEAELEADPFPDYRAVIPALTDDHRRLRISGRLLKAMLDIAGGNNDFGSLVLMVPPVDEQLGHVTAPILIEHPRESARRDGIVMPMRISDELL